MSLLKLELKNDADLDLFISIAKRLNAAILDISEPKIKTTYSSISWLEKIAENGGLKSISNPSEWQRECRIDIILPNRE